jgi:hypothetical protein
LKKLGESMKLITRHFIKSLALWLAVAIVVGTIAGCASNENSANANQSAAGFQSTWRGDNHTPPVYTSPSTSQTTPTLPDADQLHN